MRLLLLLASLAVVPLFGNGYLTNLLVVVLLHAMPAIGLALLMGYTGQISLGHAAFYGLGAYGSAILSLRAGLNPWLATAVATAIVCVMAAGLGWVIFRLRGHYLAMATLAFGIIASICFVELRGYTGGPNGLSGIPPLTIFRVRLSDDFSFFYVALAALLLLVAMAQNLVRASVGLVMRGISDSERAVAALGCNVAGLKRSILMISAAYAAVGGALYAHYIGYISPQPFGIDFSIQLVVIIAIAGFRSVPGVLFATAFITMVGEPLQELGYYDVVVYGLLLIVIITYLPQGLLQALHQASLKLFGSVGGSGRWRPRYGASP